MRNYYTILYYTIITTKFFFQNIPDYSFRLRNKIKTKKTKKWEEIKRKKKKKKEN